MKRKRKKKGKDVRRYDVSCTTSFGTRVKLMHFQDLSFGEVKQEFAIDPQKLSVGEVQHIRHRGKMIELLRIR